MTRARVVRTERQRLSPWVTLVTRHVAQGRRRAEAYHSLAQHDYVNVLAIDGDGRIPLVQQYRPAWQCQMLELPGGLADSGEPPARVAARELEEEVGFRVNGRPVLLGCLAPDSGRLENRFWAYFARAEPVARWRPEPGVRRRFVSAQQLRAAIVDGRFHHGLHVALVGLAVIRGYFEWA